MNPNIKYQIILSIIIYELIEFLGIAIQLFANVPIAKSDIIVNVIVLFIWLLYIFFNKDFRNWFLDRHKNTIIIKVKENENIDVKISNMSIDFVNQSIGALYTTFFGIYFAERSLTFENKENAINFFCNDLKEHLIKRFKEKENV